ncbi:MAG: TRAP transporter small permease [Myxococcota bacterium]
MAAASSSPSLLTRIDDGLARGEAALAAVVLLAMIALAAVQVVVDNSAIRFEMEWAQDAKTQLGWIDTFLKRATVILAFLGASLATHGDKHIAIDALARVLPPKPRMLIKALTMAVSSVICFYLARVFHVAAIAAAEADARERALDIYVLGSDGRDVHLCDAEASLIPEGLARPDVFCGFREMFTNLGLVRDVTHAGETIQVPAIDTPDAILRFIVPTMLLWMAVRFGGKAVQAVVKFAKGEVEPASPKGLEGGVMEAADDIDREQAEEAAKEDTKAEDREAD